MSKPALFLSVQGIKFCPRCWKRKSETEFHASRVNRDGLMLYCKVCSKESRDKNINKNKEKICKYLRTHPCMDCGESDILVLDFDHVRGKKVAGISKMLHKASWKRILQEVKKCDVVCANCHRRREAKRGKQFKYKWQLA